MVSTYVLLRRGGAAERCVSLPHGSAPLPPLTLQLPLLILEQLQEDVQHELHLVARVDGCGGGCLSVRLEP